MFSFLSTLIHSIFKILFSNRKDIIFTQGRETAIQLSRLGGKVVLVARSQSKLKEVQTRIEEIIKETPLAVQCDITSEEEVAIMAARVKEKYGHVDVLINNAGIGKYRVSEEISNQEMRRYFETNFYGAYYCIKALLPLIKAQEAGYILNVGSLFGRIVPFADVSVYAATKFALTGFTEGLRKELKSQGIGVGLLMPGSINTPFQNKKGEGERKAPAFLTLEPDRVVKVIEKMIRRNKKNIILPKWMLLLFRIIAVIR